MAVIKQTVSVMMLLLVSLLFMRHGYCAVTDTYNGTLEKGMNSLKNNQDQAALEQFNEVLAAFPYPSDQHETALYFKGQALLSLRRNKDALLVFKQYFELYPKGKYISEALIIYKSFESDMAFKDSVYGRLLDSWPGTGFTIAYLFVWLYSIRDVVKGKSPTLEKAMWIVFILPIPIAGIILYFFVKRYRKGRERE